MRKILLIAVGGLLLFAAGVVARDGLSQMQKTMAEDSRIEVDVPDPMKVKMLAMMRGFQEAVAEILSALAEGNGPAAGRIAEARLGMDPPDATEAMRKMMASRIPEDMRALGMAMHAQASKFAGEAVKLKQGDDLRPALAELSQVVQACNACHAAYRLD